MQKPIVRWTIGKSSKEGLKCLEISVKNIIKLYENSFEYFICFNNIDFKYLNFLSKYPISFIDQNEHKDSLKIHPRNNPSWKLYPPRIDLNRYEIFIDNDLIIYKKIDLDKFIKENSFFITEAYEKNYGIFQNLIQTSPNINSGFFGIPPGFDFQKEINNLITKFEINWEKSHFEEQGVVAYLFKKNQSHIISLDEIYVCYEDLKIGKRGMHFVGLNSNLKKFWLSVYKKFL